jgi:hypothetical protein
MFELSICIALSAMYEMHLAAARKPLTRRDFACLFNIALMAVIEEYRYSRDWAIVN